jgi:uncharacterized protein YqhQ
MSKSGEPFNYGGQAVIEGVMMRGRQAMAVAVRHPSGEVVVHTEPLNSRLYRSPWAKRPFIRGVLLLWDTLSLGMKALAFSANVAMDEEEEGGDSEKAKRGETQTRATDPAVEGSVTIDTHSSHPQDGEAAQSTPAQAAAQTAAKDAFQGGLMWGTMGLAMVFGIGLFFVSPLLLTRLVESQLPVNSFASVLVEGLIRIAIFFTYVWLIGRLPDVRRVFAYHGAEHKTIHAYEAGEPLVADRVGRFSTAHPRCGTAFLLYVVVLSIFVFGVMGRPDSLAQRVATRIAFVPVIASVAYEVIRFSARHQNKPGVRALLLPGLALQSLTTREPDERQVEVAIAALERVLEVDGVRARQGGPQTPPAAAPAIV